MMPITYEEKALELLRLVVEKYGRRTESGFSSYHCQHCSEENQNRNGLVADIMDFLEIEETWPN